MPLSISQCTLWLTVPFGLSHSHTNIYSANSWKVSQPSRYQAHFPPLLWPCRHLRAAARSLCRQLPFAAETSLQSFLCVYVKPQLWRTRWWENRLESNQGFICVLPWLLCCGIWGVWLGEMKAVGGAAFFALNVQAISLCMKRTRPLKAKYACH